jgi:hypothetical protein
MRLGLALVALVVPLAGCVVAPGPVAPYGYPGPAVDAGVVYPGYAYNDGSPTLYVDGVTWPLVFYNGGWGYWGYNGWVSAPRTVWDRLHRLYPNGRGYRPYGGGPWGRPGGRYVPGRFGYGPRDAFRPGAPHPGFRPGVAPGAYRPGGNPGFHGPGAPPGGFRPGVPRQGFNAGMPHANPAGGRGEHRGNRDDRNGQR